MITTGSWVTWGGKTFQVIAEYDSDYVYIGINPTTAQLVPISEINLSREQNETTN